ncbi:MAG: transposase [Saprospiraceae bacterium]
MSAKDDMTIPLVANQYYHIYNRGNRNQTIFFQEKNYAYFLKRYGEYMNNYWNTFAYALLPNHFHFFIQIKSGKKLVAAAKDDKLRVSRKFLQPFYPKEEVYKWLDIEDITDRTKLNKENYDVYFCKGNYIDFCHKLLEWIAKEPFRRFLLSYAKSINKQEGKAGSLFQKHFRRKEVGTTIENFKQLEMYIHRNPIHHGTAINLEDSEWTSYYSFFVNEKSSLKRTEVLEWFDGIENFKLEHEKYTDDWKDDQKWRIED